MLATSAANNWTLPDHHFLSLKEEYVKIMLNDYAFAAANDVERRLWKFCFYMHIEEHRKRIRQLAAKKSEEKAGRRIGNDLCGNGTVHLLLLVPCPIKSFNQLPDRSVMQTLCLQPSATPTAEFVLYIMIASSAHLVDLALPHRSRSSQFRAIRYRTGAGPRDQSAQGPHVRGDWILP